MMKLGDLLGTNAAGSRRCEVPITGITADSRKVKPGFLFAALSGTQTNGMRFARGASALLIGQGADVVQSDALSVIIDGNPRRRLAQLAARFYGAQPETVAAVTGTNGKTSVASFLRQIWEREG